MENQTPPKRLATNNLKKIIKDRLDQLKLSPKAADKTAGVPPDTIKSVLRGQSPTYEKLLKICNALDLRLTIERITRQETEPTTPAKPHGTVTSNQTSAARRQAAKSAVRTTYYASSPRGEIVEQLRKIPEDIVAEVIDEMVTEETYQDADELRDMAFEAGYKIW